MAGGLYVAGVVTNYEKLPPPQASESVEASCDLVQSESCFRFGDTVYYTTSRTLSFTPFAVLAGLAYLILLQGLTGATVGKFLTGLRVVDRDGRPPGFPRAFVRTVFLVVDAFPWAVPIFGWAVALGNARHRRVGDFAAGTMVVRRRALTYGRR
jgi:uncharacterized RDD family membrane protein YckC